MSDLVQKKCVPCEGGMPALSLEEAQTLLVQIPGWTLANDATRITREFRFKDFAQAMIFVNRVGDIAEREGHHPDLRVSWGKVGVELSTHAVKGLSVNDFILAAKIDVLAGNAA